MLPVTALTDLHLNEDIHQLNIEIVRLAYLLNIDLANNSAVGHLLETPLPDDHIHFHKLATLKGLLLLRGHIHALREEHGVPDGKSPLDEEIFHRLHLSHGFSKGE